MRNLTDIHHQLSATDQVYLEKQAEQYKIAEEEDAAGRIMARGFADELQKLAGGGAGMGAPPPAAKPYLPGQETGGGRSNFGSNIGGIVPMKNQPVDTSANRKKGEAGAAAFGMGMAPGTSAMRRGAVPQVNGVVRGTGTPRSPKPPGNLAQR